MIITGRVRSRKSLKSTLGCMDSDLQELFCDIPESGTLALEGWCLVRQASKASNLDEDDRRTNAPDQCVHEGAPLYQNFHDTDKRW